MTLRFERYKKIVNLLMEENHFRSDAEHIANRIMDEIIPREDEPIELEGCHQCSGKGYNIVTLPSHTPSSTSIAVLRLVCGYCFGTGKLPQEATKFF